MSKKKKKEKPPIMLRDRLGRLFRFLRPGEKSRKYADELHSGVRQTNDNVIKVDANGEPIKLSPNQKAWRSGYLAARKDNMRVYKYLQAKKAREKVSRSVDVDI